MATSTIALLSTSLKTSYSETYWEAMQNAETPILSDLEECKDQPALGVGWNFPFHLASPQAWKLNSEGGAVGAARQRIEIQGTVTASEFLGWFAVTEMLKNAGKNAGAFGNEIDRHTNECMLDITKAMQRMFTISHGTGRLAVIDAASNGVNSNTFIARKNEGVMNLMVNDSIEFYDADSGGAIQGTTARNITAINRLTREVTVDGAAITWATGWGVYKESSYGQTVNGLRGLIDDASYAASIHGQARSGYAGLNCQNIDASTFSGGELTEEMMRQMCDQIKFAGGEVDRIITNVGGVNAYLKITDGDRRYNMPSGNTMKRVLGYKGESDLLFSYHNGNLPFKINVNMPGGEMLFATWKRFMKFTNRKLGWLDGGGQSGILHLKPSTYGYETAWVAMVCAEVNIGNTAPHWNGRIENFVDRSVNRDS